MSSTSNDDRFARIAAAAEALLGEKVTRITAPGGEGRASLRLHMESRDVIGTLRPNFRRTHLEAHVLTELGQHCDDLPRCLGVVGEILFQSDVGDRRLNIEIAQAKTRARIDMADDAVAAIFRIHAAARKTDLNAIMPHLGTNRDWISSLVNVASVLEPYGPGVSRSYDRRAAANRIASEGVQFVKWDCRSGNAALDADGRLRWFDFEYAGLRHGAEDFAWLIGDEAWPLDGPTMLALVTDNFDPGCGHERDAYLEFLAAYVALHCVQRIKLVVNEAAKHGWRSMDRVRRHDDAGKHPAFLAHVAGVAAFFADRAPATAPLVRNFEATAAHFRAMVDQTEADLAARKRA
ncbi:MAG: hypothetical protein ACT4OK_18805 [Gemmobacter sp.]